MDSDMSGLFVAIVVIAFLVIFRRNKWIKPIADFVFSGILLLASAVVGGVFGFFLGYLMFGQIVNFNLSLETLFGGHSDIPEILLSSIRQKIFISTILGALLGVIIFFVTSNSPEKKTASLYLFSFGDELIKLSELKERGVISEEEFGQFKKKLLDAQLDVISKTTS